MAYWLLKSEPSVYGWDDLVKHKKAVWDGVTSAPGLKNIRAVAKGDLAVVYHTGDERQAVGLAEITSGPYPDPKETDPKLVVFDLAPRQALAQPVTLEQLKQSAPFADSTLLRQGRLSVVPLTAPQWKALLALAKTKA